jgi:hypothetical protein
MFFFERSVQWIVPYNTLIYVNWLPRYLTGFEINLDKSRKYPIMKLIMLHAICLLCKILIAMGYETMVVFHQISTISYGFRVKLNCSNTGTGRNPCITMRQSQAAQGPPWSWLHGSWNYNYLYNQRLSSLRVVFEFRSFVVYSIQRYVINYTLYNNAGFWLVNSRDIFLQIQALHCESAEFLLRVGVFA